LKRNEKIGSETKYFCKRNKAKKALLISLWSEAKNLKRKEAKRSRKKKLFFSRERAKRMRNGSRFASFRFEAKKFFLRNRRTLNETSPPSPGKIRSSVTYSRYNENRPGIASQRSYLVSFFFGINGATM
jgi:hypothetical protein